MAPSTVFYTYRMTKTGPLPDGQNNLENFVIRFSHMDVAPCCCEFERCFAAHSFTAHLGPSEGCLHGCTGNAQDKGGLHCLPDLHGKEIQGFFLTKPRGAPRAVALET